MTLSPPNLIKLFAPLAAFAVVLAVLMAVNGGGARHRSWETPEPLPATPWPTTSAR